jgi:Zn-dependent protease
MTAELPPRAPGACPQCGTHLAPSLLVCPGCRRLVHAEHLAALAADAQAAANAGDTVGALQRWRRALELLPPESRQHQTITQTVIALSRQVDASTPSTSGGDASHAPDPGGRRHTSPLLKAAAAAGGTALLLWKFKFIAVAILSKLKLLISGLSSGGTVVTMLLSLGVYWTAWGWKFALGLVLSIYVHEMGHVAALRRYGMNATAPMFIPGLGALIRLRQHPADAREDARIGLAGPVWGLATAAIAWCVSLAMGWPSWAAVAKVGAWINLFNLLPLGSLDGGRGFRALSTRQRWLAVLAILGTWYVSHEGLLALIALVAILYAAGGADHPAGDTTAFVTFIVLIILLTALSGIPVAV